MRVGGEAGVMWVTGEPFFSNGSVKVGTSKTRREEPGLGSVVGRPWGSVLTRVRMLVMPYKLMTQRTALEWSGYGWVGMELFTSERVRF